MINKIYKIYKEKKGKKSDSKKKKLPDIRKAGSEKERMQK